MKRWLYILIAVIAWGAAVAYLVAAIRLRDERRLSLHARSMTVIVLPDSAKINIIRPTDVAAWIDSADLNPVGRQIDNLRTDKLEAMIAQRPFVNSVKAFGDIRGDVYVVLTQREPLFRVMNTPRGDDFYYTKDGYITPVQPHSAHKTAVVTGAVPLPFKAGYMGEVSDADKSYKHYLQIFEALRNFVGYINGDERWKQAFEQIVFERAGNSYCVRLIPHTGEHTILLGELDDYEAKLARLAVYYDCVASVEGWNKFREIDIRYNGEVIGRL